MQKHLPLRILNQYIVINTTLSVEFKNKNLTHLGKDLNSYGNDVTEHKIAYHLCNAKMTPVGNPCCNLSLFYVAVIRYTATCTAKT